MGVIERLIGHAKWCPRKGEPANTGKNCSTCGERIRVNPDWKSEEDRLREQLRGAVVESERLRDLLREAWGCSADARGWADANRRVQEALDRPGGQSTAAEAFEQANGETITGAQARQLRGEHAFGPQPDTRGEQA